MEPDGGFARGVVDRRAGGDGLENIEIGERLGGGGLSEVYSSGPDFVVKLFHQRIEKRFALLEFENLVLAYSLGVPVPKPQRAFEAGGRFGIRMRRAEGSDLLALMLAGAEAARAAARLLAEVHCRIHASSGRGFARLIDRIAAAIGQGEHIDKALAPRVRELLESLPSGDALCHGDLHPANVMCSGERVAVLDWHDAASGPVEADIARTLVVVAFGRAAGADDGMRREVNEAYLARYREVSPYAPDSALIEAWYTVMLAARLAEPVDSRQANALRAALCDRLGVDWPGAGA
ncbi:MAG: hypothetical protein DWQ08_15665 [Proteobacteria bacterium]|nr:MAG: hypothetical protein DWQ08_15665 [Pseudomonadota bacterium]